LSSELIDNELCRKGIEEISVFKQLLAKPVLKQVEVDLSLARGLDYYTGLIYEVILMTILNLDRFVPADVMKTWRRNLLIKTSWSWRFNRVIALNGAYSQ